MDYSTAIGLLYLLGGMLILSFIFGVFFFRRYFQEVKSKEGELSKMISFSRDITKGLDNLKENDKDHDKKIEEVKELVRREMRYLETLINSLKK